MVLYITSILKYSEIDVKDVSNYYLEVPKVVFTKTYPVNPRTKITAEIEDIENVQVFYVSVKEYDEKWESLVKELKKTVSFYYVRLPLGEYDRLYLYNEYWRLLRDYGILPDEYVLKIKISFVDSIEGYLEVFPRRDMHFAVQ